MPPGPIGAIANLNVVQKLVALRDNQAGKGNSNDEDLCDVCGVKPKFVENDGRKHSFCGRSCANAAKKTTLQKSSPRATANRNSEAWTTIKICHLPECLRDGLNQFSGYCSEEHKNLAIRKKTAVACVQCRRMVQTTGNLCVSCRFQETVKLTELRGKGPLSASVADAFLEQWKPWTNNNSSPTVKKVLRVENSRSSQNAFELYRKRGLVEYTTYHSSQCICDLGVQTPYKLCDFPSCGICMAVKSSFSKFAFGKPRNFGRLGAGIYSCTNSALADHHATSCTSSPYRAAIACKVLATKTNDSQRISSTTASVVEGDTLAVRDAAAIIPTHIILYSL